MTTHGRLIVAQDVFVDNDVFLLSRDRYPNVSALGAIVWSSPERPRVAHLTALARAVATVEDALPSYRFVLVCRQTVVRDDSAVTRRMRLWGGLARAGVNIPRGERTEERAVSEEAGVRWVGAVTIDRGEAAAAMGVLHAEPASLLVAVPPHALDGLDDLLTRGWRSTSERPAPQVLDWLAPREGILFWPVGGFDDRESGVVAFACPDVIETLVRSSA